MTAELRQDQDDKAVEQAARAIAVGCAVSEDHSETNAEQFFFFQLKEIRAILR